MARFRIETNAKKVYADTKKDIIKTIIASKKFLTKHQNNYTLQAKGIVMSVVYGAYSPKTYQRTYKLLGSIKSETTDAGNGIEIYQDATMTPLKKGTKHPGYAHFFIEPSGSFLSQARMPKSLVNSLPRDFLGVWATHFDMIIIKDYNREVMGIT